MNTHKSESGSSIHTVYFAAGCFWGAEAYFSRVAGVVATQVGYAQSTVENPSYELVCTGTTDAAETVKIDFDPSIVSVRTLALLFMDVIDPYAVNQQGHDIGTQYRSAMFARDDDQLTVFEKVCEEFAAREGRESAVICEKLVNFYPAEEYHQDYLVKNPLGYCHISSAQIAYVPVRQKEIEHDWALPAAAYARTREAAFGASRDEQINLL